MPTLDCTTRREDGVTLVACRLSNGGDAPCRVRLAPGTDAVAPPRTGGLPAPGWTGGGYETVVPANATVGVGFATPDRPSDPPATLSVLERDAAPADGAPPEPTATGATRALLDPRPPRAAVSAAGMRSETDDGTAGSAGGPAGRAATGRATADPAAGSGGDPNVERTADAPDVDGETDDPGVDRVVNDPDRPGREEVPPAVAAWLARVERRGDRAALRAVADRVTGARRRLDAEEP